MRRVMPDSLLTQIRKSRGLSLDDVAVKVGTTAGTLSRVERGEQTPKKELARSLHEFFGGSVPLGSIYDAAFPD
jgi:transcriptional regulator with XRE-family HTH domain